MISHRVRQLAAIALAFIVAFGMTDVSAAMAEESLVILASPSLKVPWRPWARIRGGALACQGADSL